MVHATAKHPPLRTKGESTVQVLILVPVHFLIENAGIPMRKGCAIAA